MSRHVKTHVMKTSNMTRNHQTHLNVTNHAMKQQYAINTTAAADTTTKKQRIENKKQATPPPPRSTHVFPAAMAVAGCPAYAGAAGNWFNLIDEEANTLRDLAEDQSPNPNPN